MIFITPAVLFMFYLIFDYNHFVFDLSFLTDFPLVKFLIVSIFEIPKSFCLFNNFIDWSL